MRETIGVLITSHNRSAQTLACLNTVFNQQGGWEPKVVLVDDGSSDSTTTDVIARYPQVTLVQGSGHLYWAGGMRLAHETLMKIDTDYVLWLNDDVQLDRDAFDSLRELELAKSTARNQAIIVGAVRDPDSGGTTYGGVKRIHRFLTTKFVRIVVSNSPEPCDTMNGNVVFMARDLATRLGPLDRSFQHALGDWDYGLRATEEGVDIWMTPTHVGSCSLGTPPIWTNEDVEPGERLRNLFSPKGLPPREWWVFSKRHLGILWPLRWMSPYVTVALSIVWSLIRRLLKGLG